MALACRQASFMGMREAPSVDRAVVLLLAWSGPRKGDGFTCPEASKSRCGVLRTDYSRLTWDTGDAEGRLSLYSSTTLVVQLAYIGVRETR